MDKQPSFMKPIQSKSVVQRIIDRITDSIISGELKPGDRLPTEMELVEAFGVGRNTVREAIRVLNAYGVVEIRRPEGTFVCDGFSERLINPMIYGMILQKEGAYQDLIGFRRIIENGMMQMLQDQGIPQETWEDLTKLCDDLVEKIRCVPVNLDAVVDADIRFHNALACATGNPLMIKIHQMVVDLTMASRIRTIHHVYEVHDEEYLATTHQELLKALRGSDHGKLIEAINNSYFYWKDSLKW